MSLQAAEAPADAAAEAPADATWWAAVREHLDPAVVAILEEEADHGTRRPVLAHRLRGALWRLAAERQPAVVAVLTGWDVPAGWSCARGRSRRRARCGAHSATRRTVLQTERLTIAAALPEAKTLTDEH
jgi:hypothetical protein